MNVGLTNPGHDGSACSCDDPEYSTPNGCEQPECLPCGGLKPKDTMNIEELEPGHSVVLESAFISDVSYTQGPQVRILAVSSRDGEGATWWRFEVPKTTKVIRKFFRQYGVDPGVPKTGQYPNLAGHGDQRFFVFGTPMRVEGTFKGLEEVPTEEDADTMTEVRDLEGVSLRLL